MENLKVDNEHLLDLAKWMENFIEEVQKDITNLKDEKADIFNRYMAFNRCMAIMNIIKPVRKLLITSMISGHNLQNEIFHTEIGKKNGWHDPKAGDHPFFENECNHENDDEIPEFLRKIIGGAIIGSIIGKRKNDKPN